jgi:hypothetical protein
MVEVLNSTAAYTNELYSPANQYIANNKNVGNTLNIGSYTAGTELIFSLFVTNTGFTFYSGDADRNPDDIVHAIVDFDSTTGTALLGFEDLFNGGDLDFDDAVFLLSGGISDRPSTTTPVPEPSTFLLLGGGLALGFYGLKRKRV